MSVELVVPADCPPSRLDRFVADTLPGVSRRRLHGIAVRLNGRPAKLAATVRPGDVVTLPDDAFPGGVLRPNAGLALPILYQDEALVAVDKRAGMSSVALEAGEEDTVANFIVAAFPETAGVGAPLEAGLVHRLDRDTSGILLAARSPESYAELRRQFSAHRVAKAYLAIVLGDVAEGGSVEVPIAHDRRHRERMIACPEAASAQRRGARPAATRYQPVVRYGRATLVRAEMRTGVRHQVRVHLASIGHPIAGDALYGMGPSPWIERQALHASRVSLTHPIGGAALEIESPLPGDFEAALRRIEKRRR